MSTWEEKFNELESQHEIKYKSWKIQHESLQNDFTSMQQHNDSMQKELEQLKKDKETKSDQIYHGMMIY